MISSSRAAGFVAVATLLLTCRQVPVAAQQAVPRDSVEAETTGSSRLGGLVVRGRTGLPVRRAVVTLVSEGTPGAREDGERAVAATIADDDGAFVFDRLPPGRYRVSAAKAPLLTAEYGAVRPGARGTSIDIGSGDAINGVVVRLGDCAVITGQVVDMSGDPASGVTVTAAAVSSRVSFVNAPVTDDRGFFRLYGLVPGEYVIVARPLVPIGVPADIQTLSVADVDAALEDLARRAGLGIQYVEPGSTAAPTGGVAVAERSVLAASPTFASVYYPGTTALAEATRITVAEGEERHLPNFQLVLANTYRIVGRVSDPSGRPAAGAQVSVSTDVADTRIGGAFTDRDGVFAVGGLPPGRYTIAARASALVSAMASERPLSRLRRLGPSAGGVSLWASAQVAVGETDLEGVELALRPSLAVSGRIAFVGGGTRPSPAVTRARVSLVSRGTARFSTMSGPDGCFEIGGITTGRFQVDAILTGPLASRWKLRSAILEGVDLLDFPLDLTSVNRDVTGFALTFSDVGTELSGTLDVAGSHEPVMALAVFPADVRFWVVGSRRLVFAELDSGGSFLVRDLPPGEYLVAGIPEGERESWATVESLKLLAEHATRFTLQDGERKTVELRRRLHVRMP